MPEHNKCGCCKKKTACHLCHQITSIISGFSDWFDNYEELTEELSETIGKECLKFIENGE